MSGKFFHIINLINVFLPLTFYLLEFYSAYIGFLGSIFHFAYFVIIAHLVYFL